MYRISMQPIRIILKVFGDERVLRKKCSFLIMNPDQHRNDISNNCVEYTEKLEKHQMQNTLDEI